MTRRLRCEIINTPSRLLSLLSLLLLLSQLTAEFYIRLKFQPKIDI